MIFARRAIQRRLDELRFSLGGHAVDGLVKRLNRPGKDRLAAMWEVAILHALKPLGAVSHEAVLASGRRPDLHFANSEVSFVADITAISDEGLDEQNPHREFSEEIQQLQLRLGLAIGGVDLRIEERKEETSRGVRRRLRLPPKAQLREFVRLKIEPVLRQQMSEGRDVLRIAFDDDIAGFHLIIDPKRTPYSSYSHGSYDLPTIRDQNPLYNALHSKLSQLKGANGLTGIIVGDGDSQTLAHRPQHWSEVSADEIVDGFLQTYSSVGFVLLLSVREMSMSWLRTESPNRQLHASLRINNAQPTPDTLELVFRQMMGNMPKPISMPVNAALRAREEKYDWGFHGGHQVSSSRIKISLREFMEIMAGHKSISETNAMHDWCSVTDTDRQGRMQNPFERWLLEGRLPSKISVSKTNENEPDNWIEIEIGGPDPVTSPFQ